MVQVAHRQETSRLLHPQVDAAHEVDHVSRPQHRQQASHDAAGVRQLPPPRCAGWVNRPQAVSITRPPYAVVRVSAHAGEVGEAHAAKVEITILNVSAM